MVKKLLIELQGYFLDHGRVMHGAQTEDQADAPTDQALLYAQKKLYSLSILRVITQTAEKSHPHIAAVIMFICKTGTDVEYILHGLAKGIGNDRRLKRGVIDPGGGDLAGDFLVFGHDVSGDPAQQDAQKTLCSSPGISRQLQRFLKSDQCLVPEGIMNLFVLCISGIPDRTHIGFLF